MAKTISTVPAIKKNNILLISAFPQDSFRIETEYRKKIHTLHTVGYIPDGFLRHLGLQRAVTKIVAVMADGKFPLEQLKEVLACYVGLVGVDPQVTVFPELDVMLPDGSNFPVPKSKVRRWAEERCDSPDLKAYIQAWEIPTVVGRTIHHVGSNVLISNQTKGGFSSKPASAVGLSACLPKRALASRGRKFFMGFGTMFFGYCKEPGYTAIAVGVRTIQLPF